MGDFTQVRPTMVRRLEIRWSVMPFQGKRYMVWTYEWSDSRGARVFIGEYVRPTR